MGQDSRKGRCVRACSYSSCCITQPVCTYGWRDRVAFLARFQCLAQPLLTLTRVWGARIHRECPFQQNIASQRGSFKSDTVGRNVTRPHTHTHTSNRVDFTMAGGSMGDVDRYIETLRSGKMLQVCAENGRVCVSVCVCAVHAWRRVVGV